MSNRFFNPVPQLFDSSGAPLVSGKLYFYESGTSTFKTTYADVSQTIANPNPVILTADGRVPNIFYAGTARVVLTDNDDVQLWDRDVVGLVSSGSSFSDWNSVTEYEEGALVEASDGNYYRSLQSANIAQDPTSSPAFWELVQFVRDWNANVTYDANGLVRGSDGRLYRSVAGANLNNNPTSTTGFWTNCASDQGLDTTDNATFNKVTSTTAADFSGGGAYFGGTAAANLYDDYEEGNWTPDFSDGTTTVSNTVNSAVYTKNDRLVHVEVDLTFGSITSANRGYITLPFAINTGFASGSLNFTDSTGRYINIQNFDLGLGLRDSAFANLSATALSGTRIILSAVYTAS